MPVPEFADITTKPKENQSEAEMLKEESGSKGKSKSFSSFVEDVITSSKFLTIL